MTATLVAGLPAYIARVRVGDGASFTAHDWGHVRLDGGYVATPHIAAYIGADYDVKMLVWVDDHDGGVIQTLFSKWAAGQRTVTLRIEPDGNLRAFFSTNGSDIPSVTTSDPSGQGWFSDGRWLWAREERISSTGALNIYVADGNLETPADTDWHQIAGGTLNAGTSPFAGTAVLAVGAQNVIPPSTSATQPLIGKVAFMEFKVDGVVRANPDFRSVAGGETTITDGSGRVWTFYGAAVAIPTVAEVVVGRTVLTEALLTVQAAPVVPTVPVSTGGGGGGDGGTGTGTGGIGRDWTATDGLKTFTEALTAAEADRSLDIVVFGDSISEYSQASSAAEAWVSELLAAIRADWQPAGVTGGDGFLQPWPGAWAAAFDPWTNTGGTEVSTSGLGLKAYHMVGAGPKMQATLTFDRLDVLYRRRADGGQVDVKIDGVSHLQDFSGPDAPGQKVSIAVADGAHAVSIENVTGTNEVEGVFRYRGDATQGIRMWNLGHGGQRAKDVAANLNWAPALAQIPNPVLFIIAEGTNDYDTGRTPGQLTSNESLIVAKIRSECLARGIDPSIVIWNIWQNGVTAQSVGPWQQFEDAIYTYVRGDTHLNLFDARARQGDWAEYYVDGVTTAGDTLFTSAACDFTGTEGKLIDSDQTVGATRIVPASLTVASVVDAHTIHLSAPANLTQAGVRFVLRRVVNPNFGDDLHPVDAGHDLLSAGMAGFLLP